MGKKIKLKQTAGKVYVNDPNSYQDSLRLYNEYQAQLPKDLSQYQRRKWFPINKRDVNLGTNKEGKKVIDTIITEDPYTHTPIKPVAVYEKRPEYTEPIDFSKRSDTVNTHGENVYRGDRMYSVFKKPVGTPRQEFPKAELTHINHDISSHVPEELNRSVSDPFAMPQGEPVYGPGNSLIGTYNYSNGNGTFTSVHDYNKYATAAADRALLNNPEQLQAYMKQKTKGTPTTFKQSGGKIQFKQYGGKMRLMQNAGKMDPYSVVDTFKSRGLASSYEARKKIYENSIGKGYTGTADQNANLIKMVKGTSQVKQVSPIKYVKAAPVKNTFTLSSSQPPGVSDSSGSVKKSVVNNPSTSNSVIKKPYKYVRAPAPDFSPKAPQSGVVLDKRSGWGYITKDGTAVKQFPILTGANVEGNIEFGNATANAPMKGRATPVGYYIMKGKPTDAAAYNNQVTKFTPIPAYGLNKPDIRAGTLGIHSTWDPANRDMLYNTAHPWASYGCVNCHPNDWRNIDRTFPQGDTAVVVDSKMPWGNKILNDINAPTLTNTTANKQSGGSGKIRLEQSGGQFNTDTSIVDKLKAIGLDPSYASRKRAFEHYNKGQAYTGNADQNTAFIQEIKGWQADKTMDPDSYTGQNWKQDSEWTHVPGESQSAPPPMQKPSGTIYDTHGYTSVVDYFKSRNMDSSYDHRKKMYESWIGPGYAGSADQNAALIEIMHGYSRMDKSSDRNTSWHKPSIQDRKGTLYPPGLTPGPNTNPDAIPPTFNSTAPSPVPRGPSYPSTQTWQNRGRTADQYHFPWQHRQYGGSGKMQYCRECGGMVPSLSTFAHGGRLAQNNFGDDDYQQRQQSLHKLYPDMDNYPYNPNVINPANQVSLDNIPQQSGDMYHQYEQNRQALTNLYPGIQFPDYDYSALQHDKFKEATAKPGNNHDWVDYLHAGEDAMQYIGGLFNEGHNYRDEARQRRRGLETIEQDVQDKDRYGLNPASFLEQYGGDIPQFKSGGLTSAKAKLMLREGKANGKKLTGKQKRYFGLIAGGGHPRKQNAGEVPEIDGAPDMDPEVWAETGEVVRMRDGTISRIAANGARTFDHGERKGIPGTPINGAESFLEATSTKKGRSAMADKLLKIDRDTAEQISGGYRPSVPLSHATLYTQAAEHHGKMKLKMENRLKLQLKRGINNEANRNSIKMNMDFIGGIPSENDLYESIFQHQEATKQQNDIPDEPTTEQKAQYPNKMQLGGMAQNAKRKQKISKFKQEHPPLFSSFDDVVDFYKNNYGYTGAKGDIEGWQDWMTKTPATRTTLINYLRTAPLTAKGIKSYGDVDPKALSDKQLIDQFKDGRFDFRAPMVMNYQSPEAVSPPENVPSATAVTPPAYVPGISVNSPEFHTATKASGKPPYFPLQYEDIAASRMAYLAAQNRDPETMMNTYMPRVQYKTKDPTQALREIDYDAQGAAANLPMGTQGAGIRSQIQAGRDKSKMGLLSQYDNENIGILNRQEDVNADYTAKENQFRTQNLQNFVDHYLQSRAVAGEQKLQAADSYYKTVAKNKMFNRMTQMMKPRNYALNEDGSFSYSGSWDVNNPAMGYGNSTYDTSGTKSSNRVQTRIVDGIPYQWDPSTGRWVESSLPRSSKR